MVSFEEIEALWGLWPESVTLNESCLAFAPSVGVPAI
jgi:hypothetical protein